MLDLNKIHQGHSLALLKQIDSETVDCCITSHPRDSGRFIKGNHYSQKTELKKGQHWRKKKPHWDYEWLFQKYVIEQLSTSEIAKICNCTDGNILFWLRKHKIPARNISQSRKIKHWGQSGKANSMYGKRGVEVPGWQGGVTPERQAFYSSIEWKEVCKKVWMKYGTVCQRCGKTGGRINTTKEKGRYQIHHIVSFSVKELRAAEENLIVLCKECHKWVHSKANINSEFINKTKRAS